MNRSHQPPAAPKPPAHAARPRPGHHPVGLLYTILRHGRGLSHEEAHRISLDASVQPPKAA